MKKLITIIILISISIFAKENNSTPQFLFPLDARQLTLPPLNMIQDRDFTELLGISTTAPVPDGSIYFHADIPDSILNAGPVNAFIFTKWNMNINASSFHFELVNFLRTRRMLSVAIQIRQQI